MSENKVDIVKEESHIAPPLTPKKRKKKKSWLIVLIIIIILGALIFFFRKPILNVAREIPIIGEYLGEAEEGEAELSLDELKAIVSSQESEINSLKGEIETLSSNNNALKEKNESLKQYETMYTDFMAQKSAWDEEVAKTNSDLFIEQFEAMYPDTAERIYATLKGEKVLSDEQKKVAKTVGNMAEDKAAAALESLLTTDAELIKIIFDGMSNDRQAAILSEMSAQSAAQVIKLISPDETITP